MDPSQFNGPGLQAAPGILQWLARMMGGGERPGLQMASIGRPATQSPPTREGIGVMPQPAPERSPIPQDASMGVSFTPGLPEPQPAPMPQPEGSYFTDLNTAPLRNSLETLVRPPIPRQKPVVEETRTFAVIPPVDAPKVAPKAAPDKTSKAPTKKAKKDPWAWRKARMKERRPYS